MTLSVKFTGCLSSQRGGGERQYFFSEIFLSRISVPHLGRLIPRETISSAHWVSTAYVRVRDTTDCEDNDDDEDSEECVGCPRCLV